MESYIVLECRKCGYKGLHYGTADGKSCEKCGSGMYFNIDGGNREEMLKKHNIGKTMSKKEAIKTLKEEKKIREQMCNIYQIPTRVFPTEHYDIAIEALEKQVLNEIIEYFEEQEGYDMDEVITDIVHETGLLRDWEDTDNPTDISIDECSINHGEDECYVCDLEEFIDEYTDKLLEIVVNVIKSYKGVD
jgi:hypothetical protein